MSIIIKGMEMPTSCTKCPFEAFGDCYGSKVKRIMDIEDYMERGERHPDCPLVELPQQTVETNLFDQEEIHHNCTVQILKNSITGEVSVGWWENDNKPIETKEGN